MTIADKEPWNECGDGPASEVRRRKQEYRTKSSDADYDWKVAHKFLPFSH